MSNLKSAVDELTAEDVEEMTLGELAGGLVELSDLITRLEAHRVRLVGSFHRRGGAGVDGHTSTTSWLVDRCRMSGGEAAERVRAAKALSEMPLTRRAFDRGEIPLFAVRRLVQAFRAHPDEFVSHEKALVDAARSLSARNLGAAVAYWRQALDWERAARDNETLFEQRRLHASVTFGGMVRLDGDLDPESGETVIAALEAAAGPLRDGDKRTASQRRADGLVDICRSYLSGGGGRRSRPDVTVLVDLETLESRSPGTAETTRGAVLDPETIRRLTCDATVSRVVMDGDSQPLDVGRATRTIPPAIRRALVARDRGCTHDGCDRPPEWTDAHHVVHWADGGPTKLENLVLLCRRHHRMAHRTEWEP